MTLPDPKQRLDSREVRKYDLNVDGDRLTVITDAGPDDPTLYVGTVMNAPKVFLYRARREGREESLVREVTPAEALLRQRIYLATRSNEAWSLPPHTTVAPVGMVQYRPYDHAGAMAALRSPAAAAINPIRTLHVFELRSLRNTTLSALSLYNRAELAEMIWSR